VVVDKHIKFRRLIPIIWKRIALMTILSSIFVVPIVYFGLDQFTIGMTAPSILGTAISIFLGFRTNSAYERWFQARGYWGEIGAATRNLALLCGRSDQKYKNYKTNRLSKAAAPIMRRMAKRGVALMWVLSRELKDLPPLQDESVKDLLDPAELKQIESVHNASLKLLFNQNQDFRAAVDEGQFPDGEHFEFILIQRQLAALMTQCFSLKNTGFPTHYTYFTDLFVWLLVVLLSMSLPGQENLGYFAIPIAVLIGWIFSMIEGIGSYMDYPWANNRNVIPTDFLTRAHERDIRAFALGETELPPMLTEKDGALY
jgi:putative membrane protein